MKQAEKSEFSLWKLVLSLSTCQKFVSFSVCWFQDMCSTVLATREFSYLECGLFWLGSTASAVPLFFVILGCTHTYPSSFYFKHSMMNVGRIILYFVLLSLVTKKSFMAIENSKVILKHGFLFFSHHSIPPYF